MGLRDLFWWMTCFWAGCAAIYPSQKTTDADNRTTSAVNAPAVQNAGVADVPTASSPNTSPEDVRTATLPAAPAPESTRQSSDPETLFDWVRDQRDIGAFAVTSTYDHPRNRMVTGGMVEEKGGVTICIVAVLRGNTPQHHKQSTQHETTSDCVHVSGVRISSSMCPLLSIEHDKPVLQVPLTPADEVDTIHVLVFKGRNDEVEGYTPPRHTLDIKTEAVFQTGIWPRSAAEDNAERQKEERPPARRGSTFDVSALAISPASTVEWIPFVSNDTPTEIRLVRSTREFSLMEVVLESYPMRAELYLRKENRWFRSPSYDEEEVVFATFPSSFPGKLVVLSRDNQAGSGLGLATWDNAFLVVMSLTDQTITETARLNLGEIGSVRMTGVNSRTWRIYFSAQFLGDHCVQLSLNHAFRAQFNRKAERFGRQRNMTLKPTSDPDGVETRYHRHAGEYRLAAGKFVKGTCPNPSDRTETGQKVNGANTP